MIAIVVPVLARPHNVEPFMESVSVTEVPYVVYFVCSRGDSEQIAACRATDAEVIVVGWKPGPADFAKKVNRAFERTEEEWFFQGADDIRFSPKWDVNALAIAERRRARVIGTNDLGNPHVKRGIHSTHTLIHRSYIEDYGSGTVDGSGLVFSELYDHQWVDNEFIQTAAMRKEYAPARDSIVEHFHPHWGKNQMDATYEKATRATQADILLYKERMVLVKNGTRLERRARMGVR